MSEKSLVDRLDANLYPTVDLCEMLSITDGTYTTRVGSIEQYVCDYCFTEPGDVRCHVLDEDGEIADSFTIRSDDGRRGYLVGIRG